MRLSLFIRQDVDLVVAAWEEFARDKLAPSRHLSSQDLRDDAKALLLSIADDIESEQGAAEQQAKARGDSPGNAPALTSSAHNHAQHRFEQGFSLNEMVAEYRALRANVQRLWVDREQPEEASDPVQLVRFNEAMDQGLCESIASFSKQFLVRTESLDGRQLKAVIRILNSAERMRNMVNVLPDFTRTSLGSAGAAPGEVAFDRRR